MKEVTEYIKELIVFENNLSSYIEQIIIKNQGLILGKLKLRLFNYGVDGSGSKITPDYTEQTVKIKKANNQRSSHVTLRDTGNFYASMYLEYYKDSINIYSSDSKSDLLTTKYGEDILGLTDVEQEWFIQVILEPEIQKIIDSKFGGQFQI